MPSRRTPRRRPTGSSGSEGGRRLRPRRATRDPRRRARAARSGAGSRRSAARSARRTRRRTARRARSRPRRGRRGRGGGCAGSSRTSFGTSFGARAASSNASRPPNEWPTRTDSRAPTVSTIASKCAPMSHGGSQGELPWPEEVGREDVEAGRAQPRAARSDVRGCARRAGRRRAESPGSPHSWRASLTRRCERLERLRDHLRPALVALLHERPDDRALAVDQERAAVRRAVRLVEDAVRLRRGAVGPEVGGERVLGAEVAPSTPAARRTGRTRRRRSRSPRRGTTGGSPGGRAPRPRRPA